jgi:hypothetical protein
MACGSVPMSSDVPENPPRSASPLPDALPRRVVLNYATEDSFAPMSRAILAKLGYTIVTPEEFEIIGERLGCDRPDLRIVDERSLPEVPEDGDCSVPIIVLTGRYGVTGADQRIAGAVKRPAGLHELYRLMQQILEDRPRTAPRVATHLSATVHSGEREWKVAVLSLSENGCLIRSSETLLLGSSVRLGFELPDAGPLEFAAETGYQLVPDVGLIFHAASPANREAVSRYVDAALLGFNPEIRPDP